MQRSIIYCCLFLALSACFLSACASQYTVQAILPLSGSKSAQYEQWQSSAKLAASQVSASWASSASSIISSDSLIVNFIDSKDDPVLAIQSAVSAMHDPSISAVLMPGYDAGFAATVLATSSMPVITPDADVSEFNTTGLGFYSLTPYDGASVDALSALFVRYSWTKVGVAYIQTDDGYEMFHEISSLPNVTISGYSLDPNGGSYSDILDTLFRNSINIVVLVDPEGAIAKTFFEQASKAQLLIPGRAFVFISELTYIPSWLPQGVITIERAEAVPVNVTAFTTLVQQQDAQIYPQMGSQFTRLHPGSLLAYDSVIAFAQAVDTGRLSSVDGGATKLTRKQLNDSLLMINSAASPTPFAGYSTFSDEVVFESTGYRTYGHLKLYTMTEVAQSPDLTMTFDTGLLMVKEPIWPGRSHRIPDDSTDIIPIAFMLDFSDGNATPFHSAALKFAMQYAITRLNNRPDFLPKGKELCPVLLDDQSKSANAVANAINLPNLGIAGVIGGMSSSISIVIQDVISAWSIPQVSPSASAPQLSYKEQYPSFARVCSTATMEGDMVVDLARIYGWTEISIISSLDAYGSAAVQDLLVHAAESSITIREHVVVDAYQASYDEPLLRLKTAKPRILILMLGFESIQNVLRSMHNLEIKPLGVVASDSFGVFNMSAYATNLGIPTNFFDGWLITGQPGGTGPVFDAFKAEVAALNKDDWPGVADIIDDSPIITSTFDALNTVAIAIRNCLFATPTPCDPRNGTQLMPYILSTNFLGLTGDVVLNSVGDRIGTFDIRNVRAGMQVVVGNYTSPSERGDVILSAKQRIVWPDGTAVPPLSVIPRVPTWLKWNSAPGIVISAVAALGIAFTLAMIVIIIWQRNSQVIVSATWEFLILMMLGAILGMGSVWVWIGQPTPHLCALRIWIPPLAFVLILTPLLAKTWRLVRIFSLATFKVEPIPLSTLVLIVGCLTTVQIVICIFWISMGTIQVETVPDLHSTTQAYVVCKYNSANQIASYVTYGYNGFLILVSCYLAFRVRKLPKDFNESRWIVRTIYNTLLFAGLIIILGYSLSSFRTVVLILICVCTLAIAMGTVAFLMLPKGWELFVHPERRSSSSGNGLSGDSTRATTRNGRSYPSNWSRQSNTKDGSKDSRGSHFSNGSPSTFSTDSEKAYDGSKKITDYSRTPAAEAKRKSISVHTTPQTSPTTTPQTRRKSRDSNKKNKKEDSPAHSNATKPRFEDYSESESDPDSDNKVEMKDYKAPNHGSDRPNDEESS